MMAGSGDRILVFSELCTGKETTIIWDLGKYKNYHGTFDSGGLYYEKEEENSSEDTDSDLDGGQPILKDSCCCVLDIDAGTEEKEKSAKAILRFYLQKNTKDIECDGVDFRHGDVKLDSLGLHVEQLFNAKNRIVKYLVEVTSNNKKDHTGDKRFAKKSLSFRLGNDTKPSSVLIKEEFIRLRRYYVVPNYQKFMGCTSSSKHHLRVRISVTPIFITDINAGERKENFCLSLRQMFTAQEKYPDIKLKTKDNVLLGAHKFMLAARSPVLQSLIDQKLKEKGFKGVMQLDFNARPMKTILQWIYTAELGEIEGEALAEVFDAAAKYGLTELIKNLDKQLIKICNEENMYKLFWVAKKNEMATASAEISKFIRDREK